MTKINAFRFCRNLFVTVLAVQTFFLCGCKKSDEKFSKHNPVSVFNEAWKVLDQRYSMFSVKQVDWDSVYQIFSPQVSNNISDKDLFGVISNMLAVLKDGHVSLYSAKDTFTYELFHTAFPDNFNYSNIQKNYLKNNYKTAGPFIYAVQNAVGYIYYNSFAASFGDDDLDKILTEMKSTKGIIIDVRNNRGGDPSNADLFFSRFIADKRLGKYELIKKGTQHDNFLEAMPYYVEPKGHYYNKPICILTNRTCFSACNDFALYMSELPNVKIIGDQTGGGGGIPYEYLLSNGWRLRYTATMTLSPDRHPIENGITPNVNVVITPIEEMNGRDPILEKAYELLQ